MQKIPSLVLNSCVDLLDLFLFLGPLGLSQLLLELFEFGTILNGRAVAEDGRSLETEINSDFLNLMPVFCKSSDRPVG
jgi:hypothetical protein